MAKRFYCIFHDEREIRHAIEIWDTSFSGTALEFKSGPEGFDLRYAQNSERTAVFMATECTINMQMQSVDHFALVTDLQGAAEGRFTVKITKGDTPVLYWSGMVLPDIGRYNEEYYPTLFEIRATDGLGLLKDVEFKDTGGAYTGKARIINHITLCLNKLPYVATHFGGSDIFVKSHVDWWEETMADTASDPDALYQAYIDHATWWKYDKGEQKFLSCYEVLRNLLTPFGCRITQAEGAFWIEQLTYRAAATIVTRRYSKTGALLSTANYAGYNDIAQTQDGALLAVGTYEFFPALSKAAHVFKAVERRNFLSGANINQTTPTQTMYFPLQSNSGNTVLRMTGNLTGQVKNLTATTYPQPIAAIFKIRVLLDTVALKRAYYLKPTYQVDYSAMEWAAGAHSCYFVVSLPSGIPPSSAAYVPTFTQKIDLELPQVPEDVTQFIFAVEFDSLRKFDGTLLSAANFEVSWQAENPWIEVYSNGNPVLTADETVYETYNTIQTTNTVAHETESLIGTSTDPNTIGAIWVKPSSTYVLADDWGEGTDTPDRELEKLLTEFVLSGQHAPLRRLQGTLFGDITAMRRVLWDGVYWMLLGGTYSAGKNEFSGEWVQIDYAPGLSASPPKRRKLTKIDPPVPPAPTTGLNGAGSIYEIASKPPGTLLYPVATSTTSGEELAGAKTSIAVTVPLVAGEYQVGDTITILNPILGHFEDLTVGTTSADTDTTIDVSGTLLLDYPENSPIIKKPIPGSFGLPAGQTGQVFRHNGTRWLPYGDSSITDGWVLTWNDATGWTAQAPTGGVTGSGTVNVLPKWTGAGALGDSPVVVDGSDVRFGPSGSDHVKIMPGTSEISFFDAGNVDARLKANVNVLQSNVGFSMGGSSEVLGALLVTGSITTNAHFKAPGITSSSVAAPGTAPAGAFNAWAATGADSFITFSESGIANRGAFGFLGGSSDAVWTFGAFLLASGTERMRLTSAGRLGIGTNAPSQTLHVAGTARITGSTGTAVSIVGRDADGNLSVYTIVLADIPDLPASKITSGILPMARGGTGTGTAGTPGHLARMNGAGNALEFFPAPYLTGNQTITLSGDVTGSGATSIAATIANNAVTLAKMATMATASFLGRNTAGAGNVEVLSTATVRTMLSINNVENTALSTWAGSANLTTLGTVVAGTWNAATIAVARGGTGLTTLGSALQYLRVNAGATALEYAPLTALTGSLTAGRIPVASGATTLVDSNLLTWINNRLSVGDTGGSPQASVHIAEGSVAAWEPLRAVGTVSGNMIVTLWNVHNTGGASNMILDMIVGGANAGDVMLRWLVNGVMTWSAGIDNSDSDKWKLKPQTTPSTGSNQGITITTANPSNVGINNDNPLHPLDVAGRARAGMLVSTNGTFGTTFGTGAGTSPSLTTLQGSSNGFVLAFSTGTSPTANGNIITLTLPTGFPSAMYPTISPGNAQSATDIAKIYIDSAGTSVLVLRANGTLPASTAYKLYFNISGI